MEEHSAQEGRGLRTTIRNEIGSAYELAILPKLREMDTKLNLAAEASAEQKLRLERLESWRDSLDHRISRHSRKHVLIKDAVALLMLGLGVLLSLIAGLLLMWLARMIV